MSVILRRGVPKAEPPSANLQVLTEIPLHDNRKSENEADCTQLVFWKYGKYIHNAWRKQNTLSS
jgi:hypothetical protein